MKLTIAFLSAYLASALELGLELEGFANPSPEIGALSTETREQSAHFLEFALTQVDKKATVQGIVDDYQDRESAPCYVGLTPRRSDRSERYFHAVEGRKYGDN